MGRVLPRILFAGLVVFSFGVSAGLRVGFGALLTSRYFCSLFGGFSLVFSPDLVGVVYFLFFLEPFSGFVCVR